MCLGLSLNLNCTVLTVIMKLYHYAIKLFSCKIPATRGETWSAQDAPQKRMEIQFMKFCSFELESIYSQCE